MEIDFVLHKCLENRVPQVILAGIGRGAQRVRSTGREGKPWKARKKRPPCHSFGKAVRPSNMLQIFIFCWNFLYRMRFRLILRSLQMLPCRR